MRGFPVVLLCGAAAGAVQADQPAPAAASAALACPVPNYRVLGPRSGDRPLPLLTGDPAHGFHTACAAGWSTLSPRNDSLPVAACFQGGLLRLDNVTACGLPPGPIWVSSRWVITSADLNRPATARAAPACERLETGSYAGTRELNLDCLPQKDAGGKPAPAASPAPATPTQGH